jgi:hypothetical protein
MTDSPDRPSFDQGLFLSHLNRGKELFDRAQIEEAERELAEAYLMRPRDHKVLNLLGLIYFKQSKLDKAEEVYRKLAAESPDAHTLFYNLGLIYFKLSRLPEAESAFTKALELAGDNPKISFYLGSIYEKLHRFQDAIYQYRQAGASIMVRRVENRIAFAAPPHPSPAASPPPAPSPTSTKKPDDTAEFKASDVRGRIERRAEEERFSPQKTLEPVSDLLLAAPAPTTPEGPRARDGHREPDTVRFRLPAPSPEGRPDDDSGMRTVPPVVAFAPEHLPAHTTAGAGGGLGMPSGPFRFVHSNLMEIDFSGKVFIKQGTIYSYSGNLTFWVKERRRSGFPALVIITGTGKVLLTDREREITFMHVDDDTVFIEPAHLLACEETLTPRYVVVASTPRAVEVLALEGRGMVALSVASRPLHLSVTEDLPVSVPLPSVIAWSGRITPQLVEDRQLHEVMVPLHDEAGTLLRLQGSGRILVEQAAG